MIKEYLKLILGNKYDDTLVDFYIEASKQIIISYLNINYLEEGLYDSAIVMLTTYLFNNSDLLGLESRKEGDVSYTFSDIKIPSQIKAMLPKPKVRFL